MAISLAFGVLLTTVVTLLVVPSGYVILEDLRTLRSKPTLGVVVVEAADAETPGIREATTKVSASSNVP
jgi:hypothetical protein